MATAGLEVANAKNKAETKALVKDVEHLVGDTDGQQAQIDGIQENAGARGNAPGGRGRARGAGAPAQCEEAMERVNVVERDAEEVQKGLCSLKSASNGQRGTLMFSVLNKNLSSVVLLSWWKLSMTRRSRRFQVGMIQHDFHSSQICSS